MEDRGQKTEDRGQKPRGGDLASGLRPLASVFASFPFSLPADLCFDGVMELGEGRRLLQFTEYDEASPSHGATFYIDAAEILEAAIATRRDEVRGKFSAAEFTPEVGGS